MDFSRFHLPNSRIQTADASISEYVYGYFLGPCMAFMVISALSGTYLTQFYTDVLGISGTILALVPLFSKILSAITSIWIGRIMDQTNTAQGKARPWILVSGPLLAVSGLLLYCVPRASYRVQIIWIILSYNLFFSLAHCIYSLSHNMMVPLSTRNVQQRDRLAMLTTAATSMIPGLLVTIIMPLLVRHLGVGSTSQNRWLYIMGGLSILAIPAAVLEYCYTLERVTLRSEKISQEEKHISFQHQLSACLRNKSWLAAMIYAMVLALCNNLSHSTMLYFSNWVLGNSIESGAVKQILVNMIGQAPMGFGIFLIWPAVHKFGKRRVIITGFALAALGSLFVFLSNNNLTMVLIGLFVKSIGTLPTYLTTSIIAEALDHVELQEGFRADGFTASCRSVVQTVMLGLSQSAVLAGIQLLGYITPASTTQIISQPPGIQLFFRFCFALLPMMGYIFCSVLMLLHNPKNNQ